MSEVGDLFFQHGDGDQRSLIAHFAVPIAVAVAAAVVVAAVAIAAVAVAAVAVAAVAVAAIPSQCVQYTFQGQQRYRPGNSLARPETSRLAPRRAVLRSLLCP